MGGAREWGLRRAGGNEALAPSTDSVSGFAVSSVERYQLFLKAPFSSLHMTLNFNTRFR